MERFLNHGLQRGHTGGSMKGVAN